MCKPLVASFAPAWRVVESVFARRGCLAGRDRSAGILPAPTVAAASCRLPGAAGTAALRRWRSYEEAIKVFFNPW